MNSQTGVSKSDNLYLGHIGWRYYNSIKKKAMEQEFSWSGLVISLSIAFFIVVASSVTLSLLRESMMRAGISEDEAIHRLENFNSYSVEDYLNTEELSRAQLEGLDLKNFV